MGTVCTLLAYIYGIFRAKIHLPAITGKASLYVRFIDDVSIWTKTEQELVEFLDNLITKRASIKFKFKYSKAKIEFLDTLLYKDKNEHLQIALYRNPTYRQNYLHSKSEYT